jgi:hypothetical protein
MDIILLQFIRACPITSPWPPEHDSDGGVSSGRLLSAPARAASAAGPGNGIPGPDFGGRDGLPVQVPAMNTENGKDGRASRRHIDKSRSSRFLPVAGLHHRRGVNPAKPFKHLTKIVPRDIARQIPDMDIHSVPFFLWHRTPVFRKRAEQKEMIRETGLEAGDTLWRTILLQGFIRQSLHVRNDATREYTPRGRTCNLFFPCFSKIAQIPRPQRKARKNGEEESIIW